ncbi:hypothetical protein K470DRAFT_257773 [Piedraia hortae CBS 480.64]|uniref:SP-RING-type domain-containing protein n=1 Tax=Piedraia hortae CBS 480.64 TaxID=1314780 RepID=A0A6A7BZI2_9PEZI|nr:hypothetical protein K470DRAFT_257773 [Piedraia hortae CBS 480.64]
MSSHVQTTPEASASTARPSTQQMAYQPLQFPLTADAQRALTALMQDTRMKKMEKQLSEAIAGLSNSAAEINDRSSEREREVNDRKRKRQQQDEEANAAEGDGGGAAMLASYKDKTERMTKRMEETLRKVIDGQHSITCVKTALITTVDSARENASTQATQTAPTQARRGEEGSDDYTAFEPTDPAANTQSVPSAVDVFSNRLQAERTRYENRSLAVRYGQNEEYVNFRRLVHDAQHQNEDEMPPLPHHSEWFAEGGTHAQRDAGDDDDDLAVAGQTISTKCPLTLQEFNEPLTSKKCNHSFEKNAILDMIRTAPQWGPGPRSIKCPVGGCNRDLTKDDLHPDAILIRKIKRLQSAREREEDEGDEESEKDGSGDEMLL